MYLFGFPEGLAGGSKETSYITNFNTTGTTSQSTSAQVFLRSTSWTTSFNTNSYTGISYPVFHNGYGVANLYKSGGSDNQGTRIVIYGTYVYVNVLTATHQVDNTSPRVLFGSSQQSSKTYTTNHLGLVASGTGMSPSGNVGKVFDGFKIGTYMGQPSAGRWEYAITVTGEGSNWSNMSLPWWRVINVNTPAPHTTGATHNYGWFTHWGTSRKTTVNSYRTSTWNSNYATTWNTARLTSHITYG